MKQDLEAAAPADNAGRQEKEEPWVLRMWCRPFSDALLQASAVDAGTTGVPAHPQFAHHQRNRTDRADELGPGQRPRPGDQGRVRCAFDEARRY